MTDHKLECSMRLFVFYSTKQCDIEKLRTFTFDGFKLIAYGKVKNFWVCYGKGPTATAASKKNVLQNSNALAYLVSSYICSQRYLDLVAKFAEHCNVKDDDSDVEVFPHPQKPKEKKKKVCTLMTYIDNLVGSPSLVNNVITGEDINLYVV